MYNWKDTRNYRRFRDENGNVIANIIYVDGEEVAVSDEVYEAYPQKCHVSGPYGWTAADDYFLQE